MSGLLLVAATQRELRGHEGLVCGVGPVEAAATTARALAGERPAALLHVGIAGATGIEPGTVVVGSSAVYADLRAAIPVVAECRPDPALVKAVRETLPAAPFLPILTSAAVGSTASAATRVEAMEGFGVLRAAELAGVPAIEVRAIANAIGEEDRGRWRIEEALEALADALPRLTSSLAGASRGSVRRRPR